MREELETRELWEFSGREDDLKDLRTVLSEPRKSMSIGATFSYLMLGAMVGLAGLAGYYGLEAMLPDVPTQVAQRPDPSPRPQDGDENQGEAAGAEQAKEVETASAGPEITEPVPPVARAPEPTAPDALPGSDAAERGAPKVEAVKSSVDGIAGRGVDPEPAGLSASSESLAELSGSNTGLEIKDVAEVAALIEEPRSASSALDARAPDAGSTTVAGQPDAPSVSIASSSTFGGGAVVSPNAIEQNLSTPTAPRVDASSARPSVAQLSPEPSVPGASQSLSGGQPNAEQNLAALGSTIQPAASLAPSLPGVSNGFVGPSRLQAGAAPISPSAPLGASSTGAAGAQSTVAQTQAAPGGFALLGVVASAPHAPKGPDVGEVSSLGPLTSPGRSLSSPESPEFLGGAYSVGQAANPSQAVVVALASPSQLPLEPNAPASLLTAPAADPSAFGSSGAAPSLAAPDGALGGVAAPEAAVQSVQVAAIDEAAPIILQSAAISPNALRLGGAPTDLSVDYQAGLQAAAALAGGARDIASGPATPNGAAAPAGGVQVAAVTRLDAAQTRAPFEEGVVAPGAAYSLINVGVAPSSPSEAPIDVDLPSLSQPALEAAGHRPAPQIASLGFGSTASDDLSGGADPSLRYIVGAAPQFDLPSTPNFTVNPEAALSEPLDALLITPRANAPRPSARTAVASLGGNAPDSFSTGGVPEEISIVPGENAGRAAARLAVAREHVGSRAVEYVDDRPAWIRNGVPPRPNPQNLPVISIIIDEVGSFDATLDEVALLPPSVTVSMLPSLDDVELASRRMRHSRREVLVHLPIEKDGAADLGPRPILKGMSDVQVRETALWHLKQFQGFIGFNSTRGKADSGDDRIMQAIMKPLADSGLIFLDSRTSKNGAATKAARDAGLMAASGTVYIDEKRHTGGIHRKLDDAVDYARKHGSAIAIGEAHAVTVQAVKSWMDKRDGVRVVVQPLTYVTQVANGVPETSIIIAGLPPKRRAPQPSLNEVTENLSGAAGDLSEGASQSLKSTLSGIGAYISERLFER